MMNCIMEKLNLNYEWTFKMFGSLAEDADKEKALKEEMTLGLLPATIEWNAMKDRSILDDMTWSDAIHASGLMDKRIPLVTSFNQSAQSTGRPPSEDAGSSEGHEQDADSGVE